VRRLFLAAVLLLPALALADVDLRFARLRDQAESLGSLTVFLDKYIGECASLFSGSSCRANAEEFRGKYAGKKLYMIIGEDAASMVSPGPYQPGTGNYTIHITPLFPGGPYALTQGVPTQTDAEGTPLLSPLHVSGTVPEGWKATQFLRLFSDRQVRAQVVFTPQGVWSLSRRKSGGKMYGVSARVEAILLTHARTGESLGLWLAEQPGAAGGNKGKKK
jgi:hypothetical protein